jgi:hypothetical protein
MEHPPYSSDLAPNDFWLFPQMKCALTDENLRVLKTSTGIPKMFPTVTASWG